VPKRLPLLIGAAIGWLGILMSAVPCTALPLYAARTGLTCMQCHVNPTGAGMRNSFGFTYLQNGHSLTPREGSEETPLSNRFNDFLSFGSDMRLMAYGSQTQKNITSLFLMQGGIYLAADLPQGITLYYNNDFGTTRDVFMVARQVPYISYVKVGKFKPPYGLKLDDHTSFIRSGIGFGTDSQDLGIEVGYDKHPISVIAAVLNGTPGAGPGQFDDNAAKAASAKAEILHTLGGFGPARLGGSYYWNHQGTTKQVRYGGYGTFQAGKYITLLGEVDQAVDNGIVPEDPNSHRIAHSVVYGEAVAAVLPTLNLRVKYDWDFRVEGDIERYTLGGNYWLARFAELRFDYRWNAETPSHKNPGLLTAVYDNDAYVQLHVAF
jgi:hypothetical protein